jgi:hypothetical protein
MKIGVIVLGLLATLGLSSIVSAATLPTLNGDTGKLTITTTSGSSSANLTGLYGTPPFPTITQISSTKWLITFVPSPNYYATTSSSGGSKTTEIDGTLDFSVKFDSQIHLTVNLLEDGVWSTTGDGSASISGTLKVSEADHAVPQESFNNSFPTAGQDSSGIWNVTDQITGFSGQYQNYNIVVTNSLIAEALAPQGPGTAFVAKKQFSIILTSDGSNGGGGIPEPASIGVLGLGTLALIARRRRQA